MIEAHAIGRLILALWQMEGQKWNVDSENWVRCLVRRVGDEMVADGLSRDEADEMVRRLCKMIRVQAGDQIFRID